MTYKSSGVDIVKAGVFKKALGKKMASLRDVAVMNYTGAGAKIFENGVRYVKEELLK